MSARVTRLLEHADRLDRDVHRVLVRHALTALRIALGAVFLGFGFLKFFPGVSPAEPLVIATMDKLTLGLMPHGVALLFVACLECSIGLCLVAGRLMYVGVGLLVFAFVGILSPLVLLPGMLFTGPHHAPNLAGQYVLKDFVLVAATMVLAATLRGGRLESPPDESPSDDRIERAIVSAFYDARIAIAQPEVRRAADAIAQLDSPGTWLALRHAGLSPEESRTAIWDAMESLLLDVRVRQAPPARADEPRVSPPPSSRARRPVVHAE